MAPSDHRGFASPKTVRDHDVARRAAAFTWRVRTPATARPARPPHAEGDGPLRLERKTARADAADSGHADTRGPAAQTPKRDRPDGWHPPDNAPRPECAEGENKPHERRPTGPVDDADESRIAGGRNVRSGRCREVRPQCPSPPIASDRHGRSRTIDAEAQDNSPMDVATTCEERVMHDAATAGNTRGRPSQQGEPRYRRETGPRQASEARGREADRSATSARRHDGIATL